MLWYTGHGERHSGDWVFYDGTVSFSEIYSLYKKCFLGRLLYIVVDCCYSGQWVLRLAEYLTSQGIGACGHCSRENNILIKVLAACKPHETAFDGAFSRKAVCTDDHNRICFMQKKIERGQTPCFLDTTEICCFTSSLADCKWPSIPLDNDWSWSQLADSEQRRSIVNRTAWLWVRNQALGCVLVKTHLLEKYKEKERSGKSFPAKDFGHIFYREKDLSAISFKKFLPALHKELI